EQFRSWGGPIAVPNFLSVDFIIGGEEERTVDVGAAPLVRRIAASGLDVLDQYGTAAGPVAFPQLEAIDPVVSREEECPVDIGQVVGSLTLATGVDVLDQDRASCCALSLAQLTAS